jgi:hypothetical protein
MPLLQSPVQLLLAREWRAVPGASDLEIRRLLGVLPFDPPSIYVDFLKATNGGEGELNLQPQWFNLFDVDFAIQLWNDPNYQLNYPRHFFFGSNGGLESIAMNMTEARPWPIVAIDPNAGLESSVTIASNFVEFLEQVGVRSPK